MEFSNKQVSKIFKLGAQLLELHDENPFKIKSYEKASLLIRQLDVPVISLDEGELENLEGIGKNLSKKIRQIAESGTYDELDMLLEQTPPKLIELLNIKGLGAKKVRTIWQELGIDSAEELHKACEQGRVQALRGFGKKTEENIKDILDYYFESRGKYLYFEALHEATDLLKTLRAHPAVTRAEETGEFRRKNLELSGIDILLEVEKGFDEKAVMKETGAVRNENNSYFTPDLHIPVKFHYADGNNWAEQLLFTTGNEKHLELLNNATFAGASTEEEIYSRNKLPYIIPEMREGRDELDIMSVVKEDDLITLDDLRGCLHNHSTYSDGIHTLEQMATYCKELGYEYLGISDHSQSAFYANGLKPRAVLKQMKEIEKLNKKLAPFKIFKGIESDILNDGSLDYDEDILKQFDFVVASIHSNLRMKKEDATKRLIRAIENPYTTILGHMTGRLLLMRAGYPVDYKKVIDACAANQVIIEINANPRRLDMDWTWAQYAIKKDVMLSINPDAHEMMGYHDMYYGVCSARKGGVTKDMVLNTLSVDKVEEIFKAKKK